MDVNLLFNPCSIRYTEENTEIGNLNNASISFCVSTIFCLVSILPSTSNSKEFEYTECILYLRISTSTVFPLSSVILALSIPIQSLPTVSFTTPSEESFLEVLPNIIHLKDSENMVDFPEPLDCELELSSFIPFMWNIPGVRENSV